MVHRPVAGAVGDVIEQYSNTGKVNLLKAGVDFINLFCHYLNQMNGVFQLHRFCRHNRTDRISGGMPGMPCIYYGSEWGVKGNKSEGDPALRPCFASPEWNDITDLTAGAVRARTGSKALNYGDFRSLVLTNRQCVFERNCDGARVMVAVNADENWYTAHFDARAGRARDLITGAEIDFGGGLDIPPCTAYFFEPF